MKWNYQSSLSTDWNQELSHHSPVLILKKHQNKNKKFGMEYGYGTEIKVATKLNGNHQEYHGILVWKNVEKLKIQLIISV